MTLSKNCSISGKKKSDFRPFERGTLAKFMEPLILNISAAKMHHNSNQ